MGKLPFIGPVTVSYYQGGMRLKRKKLPASPESAPPVVKTSDFLSGNVPQSPAPGRLSDIGTVSGIIGRPKKGETWRDAIKRTMDAQNLDGITVREEIARKVQQLARAGVPWAIQWLADREDGRPAQSLTVEAGTQRNPMLDLDDEELARLVQLAKEAK